MKTIPLSLLLFFSVQLRALQIQSVTVSAISSNTLNVSVNTEAVELYYFSTWQYAISGNQITVDVCFISGFGSTIEYLNNNFQFPLNTLQPEIYHITVRIYYCNFNFKKLQDQISGSFKTPLRENSIIKKRAISTTADKVIFFPNPTTGDIGIFPSVYIVNVLDINGNVVKKVQKTVENLALADLNDGLYFIEYYYLNEHKMIQIIVRKR